MQTPRQPPIIAGYVSSAGTLINCTADGVMPGRSSAGQYSITFPPGFRLQSFVWTGGGAVVVCRIDTLTDRAVTMTVVASNTLTATDANWTFIAVGAQV